MIDLQAFSQSVDTTVHHLPSGQSVAMHQHISHDQMFYCVSGMGTGLVGDKKISLYTGDTFMAQAGQLHGLISKQDLCVVVVQIPIKQIICTCYSVNYWDIRKAMEQGARTIKDLEVVTRAGLDCGGCTTRIAQIMQVACPCHDVSMNTVLQAIQNGADTVEKVSEATGCCTKSCRALIQNMIDNGK